MIVALAHTNPPLPALIEPIVRRALDEDLGRAGDITTDAIVSADAQSRAVIAAREPGVVCGLVAAEIAFKLLDPSVRFDVRVPDGGDAPDPDRDREAAPRPELVHDAGQLR